MPDAPGRWSSVAAEPLQDCVVFRVSRLLARAPQSGAVHPFFRIDADEWVNVVALTPDDHVVMVRQWRHGVGALTLEIPGGAVDPGETPAAAAARELLEETGHRAARLEPLGALSPNPALFGNRVHTFLALDCERVAEVQNSGQEETAVELVPRAELARRVRSGEIDHALVVAALHLHQLAGDASR